MTQTSLTDQDEFYDKPHWDFLKERLKVQPGRLIVPNSPGPRLWFYRLWHKTNGHFDIRGDEQYDTEFPD